MNKNTTLILGGVRSGKSNFALELGNQLAQKHALQKIFIATADPQDISMQDRIRLHQQQRNINADSQNNWQLYEAPLAIDEIIHNASSDDILLIDCVSVWLNNLMHYQRPIADSVQLLADSIHHSTARIIMVGQEVGLAPHHEHAMVRKFVDDNGQMNQTLAKISAYVYVTIAGIATIIKEP